MVTVSANVARRLFFSTGGLVNDDAGAGSVSVRSSVDEVLSCDDTSNDVLVVDDWEMA